MLKLLRHAVLLSLALPSLAAAQGPAPAFRVAYFSPQRAFAASADGKTAQTKLSSLQSEKAKEIDARSKTIQSQQQALQQSAPALGDAARRQREQEIERFKLDLERFIQDAQAEFAGLQKDMESAFLIKLRPALDQVVKDKGLLLVLNEDSGLIAWADPSIDITADIVKRLSQP